MKLHTVQEHPSLYPCQIDNLSKYFSPHCTSLNFFIESLPSKVLHRCLSITNYHSSKNEISLDKSARYACYYFNLFVNWLLNYMVGGGSYWVIKGN